MQALHGDWPDTLQGAGSGPNRYGPKASHWVHVKQDLTLREVLLQQDHIIPGLPLFWVLAKGTDYQQRFLQEELKRF